MVSFRSLWEQMESSPLMTSGDDSRALNAVRAGKNLHSDDDVPFWDEFITLCANRDGLAELLDISPEKISSWPSRIKEQLEKLQKSDVSNPKAEEEKEVIPTGDNGAVVVNQDPYLGEIS